MWIPNTVILGDKNFYSHFIDESTETLRYKNWSHRCFMEEQGFNPMTGDFKDGAPFSLSWLLFEM